MNAADGENDRLLARIAALIEAGDGLLGVIDALGSFCHGCGADLSDREAHKPTCWISRALADWQAAKEGR